MKILVAGAFDFPIYEPAFADAMSALGNDVVRFAWSQYFAGTTGTFQAYFPLPGPALLKLNRQLIHAAIDADPEILLVWRGTHVLPRTLRQVQKDTGATVVVYNNDDPFSRAGKFHWHWCNKAYAVADLSLFYRDVNVGEARRAGARQAAVMMPYYISARDRPVDLSASDKERFGCDLVFAGHYEPDGREKSLKALVRAGLHVRLFGGQYWTLEVLGETAPYFGTVRELIGDDYARALCAASMSLCFLSKRNRDGYTRRCFEIPACGSLLLSERSPELQQLFREDEEAVYFSSVDELVEKALWLKSHPDAVARIAAAGHRRVLADGHSVNDRARQFIETVGRVRATGRL
jgi:spore maturation protein CgeB